MLFAANLSQKIKASSIKVYLSGVRSLHIEQGYNNPLENCFCLERVLRGIKRCQGTGTRQRLPITISILRKLYQILNFNDYTDALFWAACLTGFFGFLRCGEFTTKTSHFDINTSLSLADLQVDKHLNPSVMLIIGIQNRSISPRSLITYRCFWHSYLYCSSLNELSASPRR